MHETKKLLPLPELEFGDQRAFKQRSQNDRSSKRPPKLYQKQNDASYIRSINNSQPQAISFRQQSNTQSSSTSNNSSLMNSIYQPEHRQSYFEQCFEVLARIGEGSFGEVFKVRSKDDGQLYAIKKSIQLYRGETYRQERIEEVRRYEQFSEHENCITLHKAWEQNDLLYMQLELCKSNLESYVMQRDSLSETEIWNILVDLLLALKALHDKNLIHLDIKLENVMISMDNVCKLGDFGLVIDLNRPNLHQAMEGDARYIAPELLQGRFTKSADIFSLGITILELACKLDLPKNGYLWHELRNGILPENFIQSLSADLQSVIKWMMSPDPDQRPTVNALLSMPKIQKILKYRRWMKPFHNVRKFVSALWDRLYVMKLFFYGIFMAVLSIFTLKSPKHKGKHSVALTSTPCAAQQLVPPPDDSFTQCISDVSEIDYDDSPSNRSQSKSFLRVQESQIVNSTPLNHHSSHNSFRNRNRTELSRTSLQFDDNESNSNHLLSSGWRPNTNTNSSFNGISPLKRKKLFDCLDDSD